MKLPKEHIALIDKHLRHNRWLENQDFIEEMTDHYACALEEKLGEGKEWKDAVHEIDASFGGRSGLMKMEQKFIQNQQNIGLKYYGNLLKNYFFRFPACLLSICIFSIFYVLFTDFAFPPKETIRNIGFFMQFLGFLLVILWLSFYNKMLKTSGIGKEKAIVWFSNMATFNFLSQVHYLVNPILERFSYPIVFLSILATIPIICSIVAFQVLFVILRKSLKKTQIA